jgi:predicted AAA+ superfamily ATPase
MSDALDILLREVTEKDILIAKAKQKGWIVDNDNNDIEQNITIVQWYSGVIKNNNMATMDIGTAKLLIDFASSKSANKENNKEIPEDVAIPAVVLYDALTCLESAKYQKRVDILKEHNEKKYSKRAKQSYKV